MIYRDFSSQAKLSRQYDPLADIGGMAALEELLADRADLSRRALEGIEVRASLPYGPTLREKLDFYPAPSAGAPIVVFIHGGYWIDTRIRKEHFVWIAKSLVSAGFNAAVIDYAVAPHVTIDEIVRQVRASIAWLYRNGSAHGANPSHIYLLGNSVGAHLAAMAILTDWERQYGLPADTAKGACAISGVFDLEPIPFTWIQPMLQLQWSEVRRNSPMHMIPVQGRPLLISYGTAETDEFQRQSIDFATAWRTGGHAVETCVQKGGDHFTVINGLADPSSALMQAIRRHIAETAV
jgi:arylformamidase